jgi:predicted PurR-regulated permease PerM
MIGWRSGDVLRATALVTSYLLALALVWVARDIVLTAFLGVLFGLAVGAGADGLARLRIPRGIGAPLVVFGFLGALFGIGAAIAPTVREQSVELRTRVPEAVDRIEAWVNARPGVAGLFLGGHEVAARPPAARPPAAPLPTAAGRRVAPAPAVPIVDPPSTLRERVTEQLSGAARYLFPFLSSTVTVAAGLFLILVLAIYVGADPALYHAGLMHLFPHGARDRAGVVLTRVATVLRRWLVTQLIAMLTIGVVSTVTLLLLGVKAAVALGVIAGLLEFVPTVGPILSAVPAIAMGFLDSPQKALTVGLAYLVIQQLEGHVLIPMLMKEGMDLPPALTIVTQGVMALLFGFLGLMVAVPLLAVVIVPIKLLYVEGVVGDAAPDAEANDSPSLGPVLDPPAPLPTAGAGAPGERSSATTGSTADTLS